MTKENLSLRELLERQFDRYAAPEEASDVVTVSVEETVPVPPVSEEAPAEIQLEPEAAWVVDFCKAHCDRCADKGFKNAGDWIRFLILTDAALEAHPRETIAYLAGLYGVCVPQPLPSNPVVDALKRRQKACAHAAIDRLIEKAVGVDGACPYPHYADVRGEMFRLLDCGAACSVADAYGQAVWLTQKVRDKLIQERVESLLAERAQEAEKAKAAAVCVSGKPCGSEPREAPSIRALLERAFNKAGIYK